MTARPSVARRGDSCTEESLLREVSRRVGRLTEEVLLEKKMDSDDENPLSDGASGDPTVISHEESERRPSFTFRFPMRTSMSTSMNCL